MGQVLHRCATTTDAVRRAIQHSQESLRARAKRDGINQKTAPRWKQRNSVADLPTGPKAPKSTVLSGEEEAIIVAFRHHTHPSRISGASPHDMTRSRPTSWLPSPPPQP
ncbi:integrase [Azorhizobium caulinodans ORS 571]|uniref:Integrase n=1 Tax=Azorhizobium caulinodans (strain ATCC 43989 / DSM 5975 / JCM 20966 / LMG 6465 / NBRC 14845 / NCIMB 13405 / ORS 571) TaxID=438753 RepID=A8INV2_AZOC5|nr:integrase [Azorhizobium caulinodans ORS 571]